MAKNNIKDRVLLDRGITTMEDLMAVFGDLEKWEKLSQQIDTKSMKKIKDRLLKPEFYQSDLNTDNPDHLHVSEIQKILEEEYEIELSRGAVERALNTMVDGGDVNIWSGLKRGSGYWYSEADENEEID